MTARVGCEDPHCTGSPAPPFRPLPAWDGGCCPRHGAYPVQGCVGCPQHFTVHPLSGDAIRPVTPQPAAGVAS